MPAGAGGYDMGARHFGPDVGRFLQQDLFESALGDLGLAADPLTGNRYALAGGNPVSYVESDGHSPTRDNPVSANPTLNVQLNSTPDPNNNTPTEMRAGGIGNTPVVGAVTPQEAGAVAHTRAYWEQRGWEVLGEEIEIKIPGRKRPIYEDFLLRNKATGEVIMQNSKGAKSQCRCV